MRHDARPILINHTVKQTCFNIYPMCSEDAAFPEKKAVIRLAKRGTKTYLIEYPAVIDGDKLCFIWGDIMYNLPSGRYDGDIYDGGDLVAKVQFDVNHDSWRAEKALEPQHPKYAICCSSAVQNTNPNPSDES